jgi:two-component system, LytTR family, sensor histidine kinase AlgZ
MHPILGDRRRLIVYLLLWQIVGLLLTVGLRGDGAWTTSAALFLPLSFVYAFVCLSVWYLCGAFPIGASTGVRNLLVAHVTTAAFASILWVVLGGFWATGLDAFVPSFGARDLYTNQQLLLLVVGALLFWLSAACHYLLVAFEASREAERRAIELDLLAREAELRALRAQIDPHFIFNSLHGISALTASDPAAARRMCLLLAEFLRETLRLGSNHRITLADELALAERFLSIEQVRLGTRLQVASETDPAAAECLVPPLLLQPLVENAVVHGIGHLIEGGTIKLAASRDGSTLMITLENPCDPDRPRTRGVGLGLDLLKKRLTNQCGASHLVRADEQEGRFVVEVRMPAVTATAA